MAGVEHQSEFLKLTKRILYSLPAALRCIFPLWEFYRQLKATDYYGSALHYPIVVLLYITILWLCFTLSYCSVVHSIVALLYIILLWLCFILSYYVYVLYNPIVALLYIMRTQIVAADHEGQQESA